MSSEAHLYKPTCKLVFTAINDVLHPKMSTGRPYLYSCLHVLLQKIKGFLEEFAINI